MDIRLRIESTFLNWLCNNFDVKRPASLESRLPPMHVKPDLVYETDPLTLIELKCDNWPANEHRSQNCWFKLMVSQDKGYINAAERYGYDVAWILILYRTVKDVRTIFEEMGTFTIEDCLDVEIYVLPQGVEQVATNYANPKGGYYNLSLPRIQEYYGLNKMHFNGKIIFYLAQTYEGKDLNSPFIKQLHYFLVKRG